MTTPDNILTSEATVPSLNNQSEASSVVNTVSKTTNIIKQGGTLRRKLLTTVLPTVLIPVTIASWIGINFTQNQAKQEVFNSLEKSSILTSQTTSEFLDRAFATTDLLAQNSLIIESLSAGQQKAQSLINQPIEQTEQQFAQSKLLQPNANLNQYLKASAEDRGLAEIILTEGNGFNVAYSSPTSDFVQSDEEWWQIGKEKGKALLEPEFDESSNSAVLELVNSIRDANSNQLLAVTKIGLSVAELNKEILASSKVEISQTEQIQIIDTKSGKALNTVTSEGAEELGDIIGGQAVLDAINIFNQGLDNSSDNIKTIIPQIENTEVSQVKITSTSIDSERFILSFDHQDRSFQALRIPNTNLMIVASVDQEEITSAGRDLTATLALTAIILTVLAVLVTILLARQLSQPLSNLAEKAQQVATGDLEVRANLEGTQETRTLADNFNNLVQQVKDLIQGQEAIAEQQKQEKEKLEEEIYQLLDEIQDAADGDLTVRASLDSMEMSTVADLFNAVIDSLQDIALQVKESSNQVSTSLLENKESIQTLAEQSVQEAEQSRDTLKEVEAMSQSIENVANTAHKAAILADDAYQETEEGSIAMDDTVNSILSLRKTVGETAQKMKRLGESSQKIAQIVSLVEEITLKTNLLAINASRGGDQGQGFSVFGEQLAKLGEQSAAATKQISQIVNEIRLETQEVSEAMEIGNSQAADTTSLVESTKEKLGQVLESSNKINELMQSISQATVSQTNTSQLITQLMQEIAEQSNQRSQSSQKVSQSMETTAQISQQLESVVEKFKVTQE